MSGDSTTVTFLSRSHRGKVKRNNQDCLRVDEERFFGALADGVGGKAFGEVASQLAVDASIEYLTSEQKKLKSDAQRELANAIRLANEEIITIQRNEPKYENMCSTLTCFYIHEDQLHFAWVGDSRIYLLRPAAATIELLTSDHTLDQSKIDPEMAPQLYKRAPNILTRMVGSILLLKPDTGMAELKTGDMVLTCSDGLSNPVSEELMLEYANKFEYRSIKGFEQLADKLLDRALDCGGQDNISFVLARID